MSAAEGLPQWVILGAETGNRADKVTPRREWVDWITQFCAENEIPVFYKDNLRAHFPDLPPSASPWDDREDATAEWAAHYMGPVSYTHLDVYKRQGEKAAPMPTLYK